MSIHPPAEYFSAIGGAPPTLLLIKTLKIIKKLVLIPLKSEARWTINIFLQINYLI